MSPHQDIENVLISACFNYLIFVAAYPSDRGHSSVKSVSEAGPWPLWLIATWNSMARSLMVRLSFTILAGWPALVGEIVDRQLINAEVKKTVLRSSSVITTRDPGPRVGEI